MRRATAVPVFPPINRAAAADICHWSQWWFIIAPSQHRATWGVYVACLVYIKAYRT